MERKKFKLFYLILETISFIFAVNDLIITTEMLWAYCATNTPIFSIWVILFSYSWCTLVTIKSIYGITYTAIPYLLKYRYGHFIPGYVNMFFNYDISTQFYPVFVPGREFQRTNYHLIEPYGDVALYHCYRYLFFSISIGYPLICCVFIAVNIGTAIPCAFIILGILPFYGWLLNTKPAICGSVHGFSPYIILLNFYFSFLSENLYVCLATFPALISVHVFPISVRKRLYGLRGIEWLVITVTTANICYAIGFIELFLNPTPLRLLFPWKYIPDGFRTFFYPQFQY